MRKKGREKETDEIVRFLRAAEVGRLLLGEIDGLMEYVSPEQFIQQPRKDSNFADYQIHRNP